MGEGLRADPSKGRAIREMPLTETVARVQRILGFGSVPLQFRPRFSDITKPQRDLTRQDAEWIWVKPQQSVFERLKEAVSVTPVLLFQSKRKGYHSM